MEMTINQMMSYVNRPGTTAKTLDKIIQHIECYENDICHLYAFEEYLSEGDTETLGKYNALIEGIIKHPNVSSQNLSDLWSVSRGFLPFRMRLKIVEAIREPYPLVSLYDEINTYTLDKFGESGYNPQNSTNYGNVWYREEGNIIISTMLTSTNKALQYAYLNPVVSSDSPDKKNSSN